METWIDIPHYEELYEASSLGNIRTKAGKTTSSARSAKRVWKQRIMKQKLRKCRNGRLDAMVCLWKDGKPHYHLVSRLIVSAFHGDMLFTDMTVNHLDGNTLNNSADNLEWITRSDNIKVGFSNGQFDSFMKRISAVSSNGARIEARSYADMDRKLGRYKGYTSRSIISGISDLVGSDGTTYRVEGDASWKKL